MQGYFFEMADYLQALLRQDEIFTCAFTGECSDFVRLNGGRVRQAGSVSQRSIHLDLIQGQRHSTAQLTLSGNSALDQGGIENLVRSLREVRRQVPEDPFLCYANEVCCSERIYPRALPTGAQMLDDVLAAAAGHDLVGILATGAIHAGFANSLGQRNWYSRDSFNLDWSLYLHGDKAVKAGYAGFEWQCAELNARMSRAIGQLELLARPPRNLKPGRYRVYLSPAALCEIVELLGWGGFGLRAHRTGTTALRRMVEEGVKLSPAVTLMENAASGVAPDFQSAGFIRPGQVMLIEAGRYQDCLVSPRSAAEYQVPCNGADVAEAPLSIDMASGALPEAEVLAALDRGIYIGNLWYLNYSDRNAGRLTGMTRFATFWVEQGRIQRPVNVMRFDETIYHLLGSGLEGLTTERELILDASTYEARAYGSARLPGALVDGVSFTL